jgi:3-dehydrosphinganine reductase
MANELALITGGSSGLGLAMAKLLAKQNYHLILIARNESKLKKAAQEIQAEFPEITVTTFAADVCQQHALTQVTEYLTQNKKEINFLILNAGIGHVNALADTSINELQEIIHINLWGTILPAKLFTAYVAQKGRILFISSALGIVGAAGYTGYCASKAGVVNFAAALRRELLGKISVYVACPADIDTPQYTAEIASMPTWMTSKKTIRSKAMPSQVAAEKILKKCRGRRFIIFINFDVYFLSSFLPRFLPRSVTDWIIDLLLPTP